MRKSRIIIYLIIIFLLAIIVFILINPKNNQKEVCFKNSCFGVEIADTQEKQAMGLMFRKSMDENKSMLFIFDDDSEKSFWMKNTFINLDIIFIDENLIITGISRNNSYCDADCQIINGNGKYVLEINAGLSDKIGMREGGRVRFINSNYHIKKWLVK